jgi:hypothetical protein
MKHLLTYRELKESLNESKIKKGSDIVKIMSNPMEWGEDMQDRVFTKGNNFIFADTFYYGQQKALDNLVKSWSPGGDYYEYFKDNYGIELEVVASFSDFKAKGKFKKLTDDGVVYVELAIKNVNESLNEKISMDAVYIHQITGSGQDAAQNFIDDNNIDGKKLADYVKQNRNTIEKYNVRDIIAGTGVGTNKSFRKRFIKQFLNEGVTLSLVDPNTNKFIKTLSLDIIYREAEKEIETLNRKLSPSQKTKGLYWKVTSIGESINEEYDVSGVSRQDLKSILNYLDVNDISYDFDGREEILSFDVTELDKAGQNQMKKWGLDESLNEREYSDEERKDMAERGLALPDGSFPIKDLEDLKNAIQAYGRSKDQSAAAKFIAKRAKKLGADDLIPNTEDFQKSLKEIDGATPFVDEAVSVKDIGVDTVLNFKDGEVWKVTRIVGNISNPRAFFVKPHDEKTKKANTSLEIELTPEYLKKELESINEATTSWAKLMKGVKSSETGPWSLIAIDNKKVIGQKIGIRTQEIIPAHYEVMKKEFPKAKIHVEDGTGAVVWTSN